MSAVDKFRRWEQTRAKGERRFIWRSGVLFWGGIMTLIFGVKAYLQPIDPPWLGYAPLIFFPVAGYFWGKWTWRMAERGYQAALAKDAEAEALKGR